MTAHDHSSQVAGCYRCDLSRDEVAAACPRPEDDACLDQTPCSTCISLGKPDPEASS